ncbi:MAG: tetratricopeptide repeat protein [Euryarchaeota archaeon]|nr:tetratricopeptide repeat protein [Euryarchaeota archaeon]
MKKMKSPKKQTCPISPISLLIFAIFFMLTCFSPLLADDESELPPFEIIFYNPDSPPTTAAEWAQSSFSAQMLGDINAAIQAMLNATLLEPDSAVYHTGHSVLLTRIGDYEAAYDAAQRSIALDPDYAVAWSALGDAASMTNRIDEALHAYKYALSLNPDGESAVIIRYNIGSLFLDQGKFEEARMYFEEVLERDDSQAAVWLNKGVAEYGIGDFVNASISFEEALMRDPDVSGGLDNLNATREKLSNPQSSPLGIPVILLGLGASLLILRRRL